MKFVNELRRRSVFRVAGLYAVVGWLLAQMAIALETSLGLPGWFDAVIVSAILICFPVALILAWAMELTPDGLARTAELVDGETPPLRSFRKMDFAILGGLALVGAMLATGWATRGGTATDTDVTAGVVADAPRTERKATYSSIAVLPFADMSEARDQEYFSDGISEELLNALASSPDLKVAARTSSFSFKGKDTSIGDIAAALKVETVLEGSVRKSGHKLRITAQLIDAETGFHLWSQVYDREMNDIFAVQDELSDAIVSQLNKALGGVEPDPRPSSPEAYEAYLRGRKYAADKSVQGFGLARIELEKVIALDPDFADAYGQLAEVYFWIETWGLPGSEGGKARETRHALVEEALKRDPANEFGLYYKAIRREQEGEVGAYFNYAKARYEAHPKDAAAQRLYAISLLFRGNYAKSLALLDGALEIDPLNPTLLYFRAEEKISLGRSREAIEELKKVISFFEGNTRLISSLDTAYAELGDCKMSFETRLSALERAPEEDIFRARVAYAMLDLGYLDVFNALSIDPETEFMVKLYMGNPIPLKDIEAAKSNLSASVLSWLYMQAGNWTDAQTSTETARLNYSYIVTPNESMGLADLLLIARKRGDKAKARDIETELNRRFAILNSEGATDSGYHLLKVNTAAAMGDTKALASALLEYEKHPFCWMISFEEPVYQDVRGEPAVIEFNKRQDVRIAARRQEFTDAGLIDRVKAVIQKIETMEAERAVPD